MPAPEAVQTLPSTAATMNEAYEVRDWSDDERYLLEPFVTNLSGPAYALRELPPEVAGALASRASRARGDLREVLVREFLEPFATEQEGQPLRRWIDALHRDPPSVVFANPKARTFYTKWLAEYGDDSIAQMAGTHLCYAALSQIAIKHFERMRIGLAPIEQSTRYVDFGQRVRGLYKYATDPQLAEWGLEDAYRSAMDGAFDFYAAGVKEFAEQLATDFPEETPRTRKAKAFDVFREVLPMATLGQVAFFGSGQAMEYLLARSLDHHLEEVRWAARCARTELEKVIPSLLTRLDSDHARAYRRYLSTRQDRVSEVVAGWPATDAATPRELGVRLVEHDPEGEEKVIAALAYGVLDQPIEVLRARVRQMSGDEKRQLVATVLRDRQARWYKVPRAFEQAQLTFEVTVTVGSWRDIQRHRMHTQYRARMSPTASYHVPDGIAGTKWDAGFRAAVDRLSEVGGRIAEHDPLVAEYCCSFAHLVRFVQHQNLRAAFWEVELRTDSQGHPIYRHMEMEKAEHIRRVYPILGEFLLDNRGEYTFARRGQEERTAARQARLTGNAAAP